MADLSKEQQTTAEQREQYGREMDAKNAAMENIEIPLESRELAEHEIPPPLTEEEVRAKVGNQNFKNATDDSAPTSIGS
ncbi:hypothetical protein CSV69_00230 [Sporosarcina sp. P26b]|uniref:hypothetical protein n=1 Tax=Sporosarcina TaxID=1569 RepID=UPI000A17BFAD|nr:MULTISPECIES: hypothetical protein [Sporosarcina]ARK20771.1 hypothetical protein SporoP32a_03890 [Sporosarcina ureae]PIC97384.1 hypothetical protein CSV69_00230 [Sporosarcina sp. P26b]PID04909.1 hypothetical protein CSV66_12665 [Sporosarcina sp. P30]PID08169.1 hypothetical protein CSV65_12330 [Sporosarcina sp. P31]PID11249.1 hypothetical protein CSV64_12900 [Sporosarcina sp. P32b]